ncbi:MAG: YgdI/YgdR family lipoprotein [bacterium]|nr:YgdI/YgdR family lipoprotein [bacterium]
MKKRFFAIIVCICMVLGFLSGCSLFNVAAAINDQTVIATVYGKEITFKDLKGMYDSYSNYFAYYDEDVVMDVIYDELYLGAIQEVKGKEVVVLSQDDVDELVDKVIDEIITKIDGYEKTYINAAKADIPERLNATTSETSNNVYEAYEFEPVTPVTFDSVVAAQAVDYSNVLTKLKDKVFDGVENDYMKYRTNAYNKFVGDLVYDYKMSGETLSQDDAVKKYLETEFEDEKLSKIKDKYKEYVESRVFGDQDYDDQLADEAVLMKLVEKYKELLNTSKQGVNTKEAYTELLYSTSNKDVILYHYYDEDLESEKIAFFSVMHILVAFDEDTKTELGQYVGSSDSTDLIFRQEYEDARLAKAYDDVHDVWTISSTYRDDEGNTVQIEKRDDYDEIVYKTDENGEFILDENDEKIPEMVNATITLQEILDSFDAERTDILNDTTITSAQKEHKITELFRKYMYRYTDSNEYKNLGGETMADLIGYSVTNEKGENAGLMKEFSDTAKDLYKDYVDANNIVDGSRILGQTTMVSLTSYGAHMMILSKIHSNGDAVKLTKVVGTETVDKTNAEIVDELKNQVVSTYTNQSLLEFVYEQTKTSELDKYYSNKLYEMLDWAENNNQFTAREKLTKAQIDKLI